MEKVSTECEINHGFPIICWLYLNTQAYQTRNHIAQCTSLGCLAPSLSADCKQYFARQKIPFLQSLNTYAPLTAMVNNLRRQRMV